VIRARLAGPLLAGGLALVTLGVAPAAQAVTWTQVPAPTNLHALHVSDTAADLDWLSTSTGYGDVLEREVDGHWVEWQRDAYGAIELTGLTPGTTYTWRVYTPGNPGLWQLTSPPSEPSSFTTLSGPDTQPPAAPAAPTFSSTTTSGTSLSWLAATDNVEVTGYYLDQLVDGTWTTIRTVNAFQRWQSVYGLSPATSYTFAVRAFDARGNVSARSEPGTVTTKPLTEYPTCDVQLITFYSGFLASFAVNNSTTQTFTGWTITADLDASVSINSVFGGAVVSRSGNVLTLSPVSWNTTLRPGGALGPGIQGSSAQNLVPSNFAFNGIPCSVHR
jgi:hypothetical protein